MLRSDEAAQILTRILEALARQSGKTLGQKTRADIQRACELLAQDDDYDLLEDLLEQPAIRSDRITQQFEREPAYGDPNFEAWRRQRYDDAR